MTASKRKKLRRIVASEPNPQRCETRFSDSRRRASSRSTARAGVYPVACAKCRLNLRSLMPA